MDRRFEWNIAEREPHIYVDFANHPDQSIGLDYMVAKNPNATLVEEAPWILKMCRDLNTTAVIKGWFDFFDDEDGDIDSTDPVDLFVVGNGDPIDDMKILLDRLNLNPYKMGSCYDCRRVEYEIFNKWAYNVVDREWTTEDDAYLYFWCEDMKFDGHFVAGALGICYSTLRTRIRRYSK